MLLYGELQYLYQKTAISFKCTFSGIKDAKWEWLQKFNKKRKRWLIDATGILLHSKLKDLVWHVAVSFPMIAKNTRKKAVLSKLTSLRVLLQGSCTDCCGDSLPDGSFMWRFAPSRFCNAPCNGDLCYVTRCSWARIFDHHSFRHFILSRQIFSLM